MDLISPVLRTDYREFCVSYFVLRQIDDVFRMAGIPKGKLKTALHISGQRRTLVEEYYASINWANEKDVDKFLREAEGADYPAVTLGAIVTNQRLSSGSRLSRCSRAAIASLESLTPVR